MEHNMAIASDTPRYSKRDKLIYAVLGILIGLLLSMNSPFHVTADSADVAHELRKLNGHLESINSKMGRYSVDSVFYKIADELSNVVSELDDIEGEMRRHR
ncbi:MAG: hypothetical protein OXN17_08160 [Candidatus Poribacteria bacterium]|nr:hypothetical protein [Candidatus Poribacteria bacterium]MDE0503277.1 hypothetical protein [Candidatus Poribacteria bacterium]